MALSDFILQLGDTETLWVDLTALGAPADWDGRVWITPAIENVCPNRRLTVEVLATADAPPAGVDLKEPIDLLNMSGKKKTFPVPRHPRSHHHGRTSG